MFAHSGSGPFAGAPHRGRHGRRPCARGDGHDFIRVGGWPVASLADLDDGLGNALDLAVEEVLHLVEPQFVADQAADAILPAETSEMASRKVSGLMKEPWMVSCFL